MYLIIFISWESFTIIIRYIFIINLFLECYYKKLVKIIRIELVNASVSYQ